MNKSETLIQILKLPIKKRTDADICITTTLLDSVKFFKDNKLSFKDLQFISRVMTYSYFEKGESIIEYNSYGDKFYIILKGCVSVLIPIKVEDRDGTIHTIFKIVAKLEEGKSFGELALINNTRRLYTF